MRVRISPRAPFIAALAAILVAVLVIYIIVWAVNAAGFPEPFNWIVKGIGVLVVLIALANQFGYAI